MENSRLLSTPRRSLPPPTPPGFMQRNPILSRGSMILMESPTKVNPIPTFNGFIRGNTFTNKFGALDEDFSPANRTASPSIESLPPHEESWWGMTTFIFL